MDNRVGQWKPPRSPPDNHVAQSIQPRLFPPLRNHLVEFAASQATGSVPGIQAQRNLFQGTLLHNLGLQIHHPSYSNNNNMAAVLSEQITVPILHRQRHVDEIKRRRWAQDTHSLFRTTGLPLPPATAPTHAIPEPRLALEAYRMRTSRILGIRLSESALDRQYRGVQPVGKKAKTTCWVFKLTTRERKAAFPLPVLEGQIQLALKPKLKRFRRKWKHLNEICSTESRDEVVREIFIRSLSSRHTDHLFRKVSGLPPKSI